MPDTFAIRRAQKSDVPHLADLWLQFLRDQAALEPRFGMADDARERWENDAPTWLQDETQRIFVAEQDDHLVGFVTAHRWTPPPIYAESSEVYIDELYVVPEARRQGVGRQLVEAIKAWAVSLSAGRLRMGMLAANEAGRAFWEAQQARPFAVTLTIELEATTPEKSSKPKKGRLGF